MEYIGDESSPAPLMKDVTLKNPKKIFDQIIDIMKKLYKKADLVYGDMSAFNFLYYNDEIYLIDLGQAVLLDHPNSEEFLRRDIHNIISYFKKYKLKEDENKIYKKITA
jgi:RIO kinase 1